MRRNFCDVDSAIVELIGRKIIGSEESAQDSSKAVLALYLINIITSNSNIIKDYYLTIGDENIFQKLLSDHELLDNIVVYFFSRDYKKIGELLTEFLINTARTFVIHIMHAPDTIS